MPKIGQLPAVEPWLGDRPDPDHGIDTPGCARARQAVEAALGEGARAILLWGPPGHGKTLLLRSLWESPPPGYSPLFVPFASVEPDGLAAWIVSTMRRSLPANPRAALIHLLRARTSGGKSALLLVDEVQAIPPETLAALFELVEASSADVRVVVAGWESHTLDSVPGLSRDAIRRIRIADAWSAGEVEQLLDRIASEAALSPSALRAAVDAEGVAGACEGNPRRVRKLVAAKLERLELPEAAPAPAQTRVAARERVLARGLRSLRRAGAGWVHALTARGSSLAGAARRAVSGAVGALVEGTGRRAEAAWVRARSAVRVAASRARSRARAASSRGGAAIARAGAGVSAGVGGRVRHHRRALSRVRPPRRDGRSLLPWGALGFAAGAVALGMWIGQSTLEPAAPADRVEVATVGTASDVAAPPPEPADPVSDAETAPTEEAAQRVRIHVNSHPWSHVEIDGQPIGSTPLTISLAPGPHRFRLAMSDGRIREEIVEVSAERDRVAFR